jgi:hypothetical protein
LHSQKIMTDTGAEKKVARGRLRKFFRITYYLIIHGLAVFALFLIFTATAVYFKWTNQSGSTDVNNRYFNELSDKYGREQDMDSSTFLVQQELFFQKLGILAKYKPADALKISKAYEISKDVKVGLRMFDAVALLLKDKKSFQRDIREVKSAGEGGSRSVFEWSNYKVWDEFCSAVLRDKRAIDSASRITGVESRLIVMCLVGEQVRMFNSGRERFKQYVYPFTRVIMTNNRGYGVTSILEHTALRIESNLKNPNSPFYPGEYFSQCLNYNDAFPHLVIDSIKAHRHKTIQRLIKGGDHFYSYLYTGFLLRQYYAQWTKAGFDISKRPEVLGTLFNIGFHKSVPKANPEAGGSTFNVAGKNYTFGGLCFEFYYSGEMINEFPITSNSFLSVDELKKKNAGYLKVIDELMKGDSTVINQTTLN